MDDDIPPTLYMDNLARSYYEIYSIKKIEDLNKELSNYFTKNYISTMNSLVEENVIECENKLYLVRGARGYGAEKIDFDSLKISIIPNLEVKVNVNLFSEFEKVIDIKFKLEDGRYKIDSIK